MDHLERLARDAAPGAAFWSARFVTEESEYLSVRRDAPESPGREHNAGVMVCVAAAGGIGYAATGNVTPSGLRDAFARARELAAAVAPHSLIDPRLLDGAAAESGRYASPTQRPAQSLPLRR